MLQNFEKDNFKPFKNEIFNIAPTAFTFKNTIVDSKRNPLNKNVVPLIPSIYFNYKDKHGLNPDNNIGSRIINSYYIIKFNLKKLCTIKKYILSILKSSQFYLEKIKVSKERYRLFTNNLIIKFNDNLNNNFDFNTFKNEFITNNLNLLKGNNDIFPEFFTIFQNEYNFDSKSFFITLFKEYINVKTIIQKYIGDNCGLLAFNLFFDIGEAQKHEKMKYLESLKSFSKNTNNTNYNDFILYGTVNNIHNHSEIKVGNIYKNSTTSNNYKITKIDFMNSSNKPYTLKYIGSSTSPPISPILITENNLIKNYKQTPQKITKRNMVNKIHNFDLLYRNIFNQEYYKNEHTKKINTCYNDLKKSVDKYVGPDAQFDLFNIICNSIEADYNAVQFIFYYVKPLIFNRAVDINFMVKDFISKRINNFEKNYDNYIDWYNIFIGAIAKIDKNMPNEESDFEAFFEKTFKEYIE